MNHFNAGKMAPTIMIVVKIAMGDCNRNRQSKSMDNSKSNSGSKGNSN